MNNNNGKSLGDALALIFALAVLPSIISTLVSMSDKDHPFGLLGLALFFVWVGCWFGVLAALRSLRDHIPADALDRLGHPIPQDAVDRRWIKEIEGLWSGGYPITRRWFGSDDPLSKANFEAEQEALMLRLSTLLRSAKAARGLRLPKAYTPPGDD